MADEIIYRLPPLKRFFSTRNPAVRYLNLLLNTILEALLLIAATALLSIALLHLAKMMWLLYMQTPMGRQFLISFHEKANTFNEILLGMDLWVFGADLTFSAFMICLFFCSISYFLHLYRYFFYSLGFFKQLLFWGMPLSAAVAFYISWQYGISPWTDLMVLTAIPTCCVLFACFRYARRLLMEAGELLEWVIGLIENAARRLMGVTRNPPRNIRLMMDQMIRLLKKM